MKPLLKQIPWRTLLAVGCAFLLCMAEITATVARTPCKPHTAVRFEIAEFSEQLGPCTQVKSSIQSEVESILEEKGVRLAARNEYAVPLLKVSITGFLRDDGRGYYTIYYRLIEDLDHVVDGEHFTISAITTSNRPTIDPIDTTRCGDIQRHLRNLAYDFPWNQHSVM